MSILFVVFFSWLWLLPHHCRRGVTENVDGCGGCLSCVVGKHLECTAMTYQVRIGVGPFLFSRSAFPHRLMEDSCLPIFFMAYGFFPVTVGGRRRERGWVWRLPVVRCGKIARVYDIYVLEWVDFIH